MPRNRENRMMQPKRQRRRPVRELGKRERRERSRGGGGGKRKEERREGEKMRGVSEDKFHKRGSEVCHVLRVSIK